MNPDTLRLIAVVLILLGLVITVLGIYFSSSILCTCALLFHLLGWGSVGYPHFENWQKEERVTKVEHLQSEIPKEVKLKRLDAQLQHRDIDLKNADSVSYSDGSLKIFFTQKHLIGSDDLITWTVKVRDESIESVSRLHS